jgi:serine protease
MRRLDSAVNSPRRIDMRVHAPAHSLPLTLLVLLLSPHVVAAQELEPQQVIVKWREQISPAARSSAASLALRDAEARVGAIASAMRATGSGAEVLRLNRALSKTEMTQFLAALADSPQVEYAEEDLPVHTDMTPNDEFYSQQWHMFTFSTAGMRLPAAWDLSTGSGVHVAVLDTGYATHVDDGNILAGYDLISDPESAGDGGGRDPIATDPGDLGGCSEDRSTWHGTLMAGIIGARTNNDRGVAGVAFDAFLRPVRVIGRCNTGWLSDLADGIRWAVGERVPNTSLNTVPAKILNISVGSVGACTTELQSAIDVARASGALVVVSAGNEGRDVATRMPAGCAGVLTVAAVKRNGSRTDASNFGEGVALAGPGGDGSNEANLVLTISNSGPAIPVNDTYRTASGTSAAAANVSGVAALVWARTPSLTADQVAATLRETARPFPGVCAKCGMGLVDAAAAVAADRSRRSAAPTSINANPTRSFSGDYTVTWSAVAGATHYWMERAAPASWGGLTRLTGTSRSYVDQTSREYRHRVRACNAHGCSDWIAGSLVTVCNPECE